MSNNFTLLLLVGICLFFYVLSKRKKKNGTAHRNNIPDVDSLTVLLMLFEVRCIEIGCLYSELRNLQRNAGDDEWTKLFLKNCYQFHKIDMPYYCSSDKKQEQKNEEKAYRIWEKRFKGFSFYDSRTDLIAAFKIYLGVYNIQPLQGVGMCGKFENITSTLMTEYNKFNSVSEDLLLDEDHFFSSFKVKAIDAQEEIEAIWEEVLLMLKSYLAFFKVQNKTQVAHINIEKTLSEIEALESLTIGLKVGTAISNKNYEEKLIINKMKTSPLRSLR